jgi:hypothetical protein
MTRCEEKYLCPLGELAVIRARIRPFSRPDVHGRAGVYAVRSLYFDGPDLPCLAENDDGVDPRSKYRLRLYDGDPGLILLEIKRRDGALTEKDTVRLTRAEAEAFLAGTAEPGAMTSAPARELALRIRGEGFAPSVLCEYRREAHTAEPGHVRITFDSDLRACRATDRFFDGLTAAVPVFPPGQALLEVKYTVFLPDALAAAADAGRYPRIAFSKYRLCRTHISPDLKEEDLLDV